MIEPEWLYQTPEAVRQTRSISRPNPTAQTLAGLRSAGVVTATVASLATGWGGLPFVMRDSHRQDDDSESQLNIAVFHPR